jgi:hypothetical protein
MLKLMLAIWSKQTCLRKRSRMPTATTKLTVLLRVQDLAKTVAELMPQQHFAQQNMPHAIFAKS